jgi:phage tail tape-measure protein
MANYTSIGSGAASGAATGAAIGSVFPGYGTAIGAGIGAVGGGLMGYFAGKKQDEANDVQTDAIGDARKRLQELATSQRAQREADLQRALAYFAPVQQEMGRLYGTGAPPPQPAPASSLGMFAAPTNRRGLG